jgi:hypothetical protein
VFRSKTVFIVGAGASHEVGLPVGDQLRPLIANKLNLRVQAGMVIPADVDVWEAIRECSRLPSGLAGDVNAYLHSASQLRAALPLAISIDNLLDAHRDNKKAEICGKLGITACILEAERSSTLYSSPIERTKINFENLSNTWYVGFIRILTEHIAKSELDSLFKNIAFLSFNYDRCIEQCLFEALIAYYGISPEESARLMASLTIIHPYGSIGRLSWQTSNVLEQVSFGASPKNLLALAKQIKTFNERVHEAREIEEIRNVVQSADTLVFLGFSFQRQNLELIEPEGPCSARRVYATTFGISESDCVELRSDLEKLLKQKKPRMASIELKNIKCSGLFKEYWRSLTADS